MRQELTDEHLRRIAEHLHDITNISDLDHQLWRLIHFFIAIVLMGALLPLAYLGWIL